MDNERKDSIIRKAMQHMGKPIDEITRRMTFRARSPGVKPTTGIKLILPKTSSMAEKIQKVLDGDDPKKLKQMNNLVIGREDDGKEISLEFKTSASRERFRKMMNESVELDEMKKSVGPFTVGALKGKKVVGQLRNVEHYDIEVAIDMMRKDKQGAKISVESKSGKVVHTEDVELDESVKIMFKGFGKEVTEFQQKLKKFGQAADYRIMMQNLKNHSNVGDGLYFTETSKGLGFEIHSVRDRMMGDKIRKLGDSQDLGGGKTVTLIAINEDVQLDEGTMNFLFDSPLKAGAFAQRIMRDKLASEVDRYVDHGKRKEVVEIITHPNNYEKNDILKLAKRYKGTLHSMEEDVQIKEAESLRWTSMKDTEREELVRLAGVPSRAVQMEWKKIPAPLKEKLAKYINKSTKAEFALVEEKAMTYVIDRKTKKIVHGPTDTGDAKLYLNKQVQPRKFMIRQIRGAAKKVGDTV